jgi:hypothetical protein
MHPGTQEQLNMAIDWNSLDEKLSIEISAKPQSGIWTLARSYLGAGTIVRIEAEGQWKPLPAAQCGPEGLSHWAYSRDRLLTKSAPFGALIGKIGGSNIEIDGTVLVIGSICVFKVDKEGPLYLTINDAPDGFADNEGEVKVIFK